MSRDPGLGSLARGKPGAALVTITVWFTIRSVLLIGRETASQVDLAAWARYVTDMLPAARAIGRQPDVVTLYVQGLAEAPQLRDEVVRLMEEGAHLLRR